MTYYTGDILLLHPDDGAQVGVVGKVEFAIADLREHGPHWVLDGDADDYSIAHLFEADGDLTKEAFRALGLIQNAIEVDQLLILHRLRILPEARGRKLGTMVINRIIQKFGAGCNLVAMVCRPLQLNEYPEDTEFGKRMALDSLPADEIKATQTLARYYRSMGFKGVKGSDGLMVKLL
jgi:GNAT superfamily N-acetyltransferase